MLCLRYTKAAVLTTFTMKLPRFCRTLLAVAAAAILAGCASLSSAPVQMPENLAAPTAQVSDNELAVEADFSPDGLFVLRPMADYSASDILSTATFQNLHTTAATVGDVLQLLSSSAGLQLVYEGTPLSAGPSLHGISGSLPQIMATLSNAYGLNWRVDGKQLVVSQEMQYLLQLPPQLQPESLTDSVNTLKQLGARNVYLNKSDATVVLSADMNSRKKITDYLNYLRNNRSLIVYDIDIWQVNLSEDKQQGIDWSSLNWTYSASRALNAVNGLSSSGAGVSFNFSGPSYDGKLLATWLQTQGTVKSISRPRLAIMSGTKGVFSVGQTVAYVSSVGTTVSGDTAQTTTQTATVETGLKLAMSGDISDNTVQSKVSVSLSELLSLKSFKSGTTEIALPQTATRQLETTIRARPGDTVLLGGITTANDSTDVSGSLLSVSSRESAARSELVIAIRPRIIKFAAQTNSASRPAVLATSR